MRKRIVLAVLLTLLCLGICVAALEIRCRWKNTPPKPIVYPGSILVEESPFHIRPYQLMTYHYLAEASPDEIIEFYEQYADCSLGAESAMATRRMCGGEASPFGEYIAYIPLDVEATEGTAYIVEVRWSGCTYEIE
jgi:hypothetical protein